MTDMRLVTLRAGALTLVLSPSVGGSIRAFESAGRRPLLRPCNSDGENVLDAGCFPLVPFVNRIRGGTFAFRGKEIRLAPNMASDRSSCAGAS